MEWSVLSVKVYQVQMGMRAAVRIYAHSQYYRQQRLFLGQIKKQKPGKLPGFAGVEIGNAVSYLILASLYGTCLRTTGSYFFISSLSGVVRLFLVVV